MDVYVMTVAVGVRLGVGLDWPGLGVEPRGVSVGGSVRLAVGIAVLVDPAGAVGGIGVAVVMGVEAGFCGVLAPGFVAEGAVADDGTNAVCVDCPRGPSSGLTDGEITPASVAAGCETGAFGRVPSIASTKGSPAPA
jgi:hypothetical protein